MKLVLYVKGFPPREFGGPVMVAYHLVREFLRDHRLQVTLIVQTDCSEEEIRHSLSTPKGLTVLRLRYYPSLHDLYSLPRVMRALREADLVYFNEFPFRHVIYPFLAKLKGIPPVFGLHGALSMEVDTIFGPAYPLTILASRGRLRVRFPRPFIQALLALYRWFAPLWTAIITNSEAQRRRVVEVDKFDPSRIWVIPPGVDLPAPPTPSPVSHDDPLRLLFVGKLEKIKGPDLLLAAIEHLGREGYLVDLSIVGTGSLEVMLREWAERLRTHRVTFHGFRYGEDLQRLYEWSDVVVIPSRYESFGIVVLEAMAAGRPIVATAVGGIPEILDTPRNALLVDPDAESLARAIQQLGDEFGLRAAMARANLRDVRRYSWSATAERYLSLYQSLVRGTAVPPPRTPKRGRAA